MQQWSVVHERILNQSETQPPEYEVCPGENGVNDDPKVELKQA